MSKTPLPSNNPNDLSTTIPFDTTPKAKSKYSELVTSTTMFDHNTTTTNKKECTMLQNHSVCSEWICLFVISWVRRPLSLHYFYSELDSDNAMPLLATSMIAPADSTLIPLLLPHPNLIPWLPILAVHMQSLSILPNQMLPLHLSAWSFNC